MKNKIALNKTQLGLLEKNKPSRNQAIIYHFLVIVFFIPSIYYISKDPTSYITIGAFIIFDLTVIFFAFLFLGELYKKLKTLNNDIQNAYGIFVEGKISGQDIFPSNFTPSQMQFWMDGQPYVKLDGKMDLIKNGNHVRIFVAPLSKIVFEIESIVPDESTKQITPNLLKSQIITLENSEKKYISSLAFSSKIIGNSLVFSIYLGPIIGYFLGLNVHDFLIKYIKTTVTNCQLYSVLLTFILVFIILMMYQGLEFRSILKSNSKLIIPLKIDGFSTFRENKKTLYMVKLDENEKSFDFKIEYDVYVALSSYKESIFHFDTKKQLLFHVFDTSGKLIWSAINPSKK